MASKENIQLKSGWKEKTSAQQRTVRVLGLNTDDEETCKLYFESTNSSGGGEVEGDEIKWDADESCFLITFTDDEAVQRVLERHHTLKGKQIIVQLWSTPSSSQLSSNIILSGVPEGTSDDLLQNFLESLADVNVSSISLNHLSGKAVVALAEPVEIAKLKRVCSKNNLNDNVKLSVQSAPVSDTILVQNIRPETNDECVKFFFTNKKRNNGGPVKMVKRLSETSALICFQDPKDAEAVVKKDKHVLDDKILQVTLHFSEFKESKAYQADSPGRQNFTQHQHHMEQQSQKLSPTSSCGIIHQKFPSQGANTTISLPHNEDDYTGKHEDMDWSGSGETNIQNQRYLERGGKHYYHSNSQDTVLYSHKECVGSNQLFATQSKPIQNTRESQTQYHSRNRGANSTYSKQGLYAPQSEEYLYEEGIARPHNNAHRGFVSTENVSSRHLSQNSRQMGMKYQDKERSFSSPSINLTGQIAQAMQDDRKRIYTEDKLKEIDARLCFTDKGYRVESVTLKTSPKIWETRVKETLNEIEQFITYSYQHMLSHGQSEFENSQAMGGRGDRLHFGNPYSHISFGNPHSDRCLPSHDKVNRTGVSFGENTSPPNTSGTSGVDHFLKDLYYLKVDNTKQDRNCRTVVKEDTIKLKPHQMKYFSVPEACPMLEKKHQGLELKLDKESERLKIRAPESMFMQVKSDVLSFAIKLCERKIPISKAMAIMYSRKETKDFIQEMLGKGNNTFYWEVGDVCIIVCTPEEEFKNCEHKFLLYFKEDEVTLDAKMTSMLKSEEWKTLEKDMQQSKLGCIPTVLMTSNDEKKIIIVDRAECIEEAKQKILAFFQDNKPEKRKLPASKSQLKSLHEFRSGILEEMHVKANEMGMNFVVNKDDLILEGPVNSVSSCFDEMKAVQDKIICKRETFSGPGVAKHLLSSKGKDWLEQIGRVSKCLTTDSEQNPRSAQSGDNLLATCDLGMGTQIVITQGNITQCAVDVIVNAANPNLQHAYGLAAAIVRAGGQAIQDECSKFIQQHGPLPEGRVVESCAGHLQFTCILHAISPVWHGGNLGEKDILADTVKKILQMAEKKNFTSLAIPALSCGLSKYPINKATEVIVHSIGKHFTSARARTSLRKVVLIDTRMEPLKGFVSAAVKFFGINTEVKAEQYKTILDRPNKERFASESTQDIQLPRHWAKMGKDEMVKLVDLDPSSSEYKQIEQNFNKAALKRIQRVQNPMLLEQYKVKKKELEKYNTNVKENEKWLWHGTDAVSVQSIITNGFNRSYCGKNGTALGNGVYFAKNSRVSMRYARDGYMFQARVLVGEPAQGAANMKVPPKKPNSDRLYDSLADSPANPNVYVIFHDSQAYPEYLLTF